MNCMARENAASFRQGNSDRQALPNMGIPTEGEAGGLAVKLICKVGEEFWGAWEE